MECLNPSDICLWIDTIVMKTPYYASLARPLLLILVYIGISIGNDNKPHSNRRPRHCLSGDKAALTLLQMNPHEKGLQVRPKTVGLRVVVEVLADSEVHF